MEFNNIRLFLDLDMYTYGVYKYIVWNYTKIPHVILFGQTGSGKTYLLKMILARIGLYVKDSEIIICDYKSDQDFSFLTDCKNFFRFHDCMGGLNCLKKILEERQTGQSTEKHFVLWVFDEWASFINSLDKKAAEQAKQDLAMVLMLGRSFNIHILISQQRCDSSYFSTARDNFGLIIGLGLLSKESIQMMFNDYKEEIYQIGKIGTGWALNGNELYKVLVPKISNIDKIHNNIISAVNRFA